MERVHWQATPPGGWKYQQGDLLIKSESKHQLIVDVTQHRLNNQIYVGDVIKDIENQLLKAHPEIEINRVR